MKERVGIEECLRRVRHAAAQREPSDCLFRGEERLYQATRSSHYRLFSESKYFTPAQALVAKGLLVTIAQLLEVVGLARPVFRTEAEALASVQPATLRDINEVVYCFMQHYHLATPFIDLTSDIDVAASFATYGAATKADSRRQQGVIYIVSKRGLKDSGFYVFENTDSRARRPLRQRAVSLFLERDANFQDLSNSILSRFEFDDTSAALASYDKAELYDAAGDHIASEVAALAYRCAYGDLAPTDPSAGRVIEYFGNIAYRLAGAGAAVTA